MSVIPAQVAGVPEIVVATPPGRKDGRIPDVILAAAAIAGIDTIYTLGGAQAVAALAFGTESVPRVDKIVGPGNLFTTLAKRQVYGIVGIDGLYGPTETVVVADDTADPAWVAADMLAQAEHDVLATAILFTPSRKNWPRGSRWNCPADGKPEPGDIIAISLANRGGIVLTADLDEACQLASDFAAEHTCIATENPAAYVDKIPNAGGLFIGERSFEVLGDYVAGPSHVMPTNGTARFASPLNVLDFVKISSILQLDDATSARLSVAAARIAQAEALDGHANAANLPSVSPASWLSNDSTKARKAALSFSKRMVSWKASHSSIEIRTTLPCLWVIITRSLSSTTCCRSSKSRFRPSEMLIASIFTTLYNILYKYIIDLSGHKYECGKFNPTGHC
jgi:histidinol dehydrogenase